jgi:hypothetical protein
LDIQHSGGRKTETLLKLRDVLVLITMRILRYVTPGRTKGVQSYLYRDIIITDPESQT